MTTSSARQAAFLTLRTIHKGAFADVALDRTLQQVSLGDSDRRLFTELVYGTVRRQRTLDALIDQLGKKKSHQQPPDLRTILHLGLYQLRYLNHIPAMAAVDTTVELAKQNKFAGLAGFVNGLLRQYVRLAESGADPLTLPANPVERLGLLHSYPDWIVALWEEQLGVTEAEALCDWMNQTPHIDLRVNLLKASAAEVEAAMQAAGVRVQPIPGLPQGLRLVNSAGSMKNLPGFNEGWWMVQDASAQLVAHLLNPQPGETVIDACAAPGGKTMHLAELMGDRGVVWACDRNPNRLKKLQANAERLQMQSVRISTGDSRDQAQFQGQADRVLLDAPCSGLGTLHRHADARWKQTPETVAELAQLQNELLAQTATWVKPGGVLVYATCTVHPSENEAVVTQFLSQHPEWQLEPPGLEAAIARFAAPEGWLKLWSHQTQMDGFFMVRLRNGAGVSQGAPAN